MTRNDIFTQTSLPNGLRIVHRREATPVEYCGLAVGVGSRYETTPDLYGLAHFVEHTIFKGTHRRRSWHIINRMESVGGELNAYTSEEVTAVYSVFPRGNLARAAELLADLTGDSQFPAAQIDREREVVLDEIDSYLDTPSEAVFDDWNDLMFASSSLGHNILGNAQSLAGFTPEVCRRFLHSYYTPANMVFFYLGAQSPDRVARIVERYFGAMATPSDAAITMPATPPETTPFDVRRPLSTHQAHTVTGARIPGLHSDPRRVFSLLNNILGGPGMNSLLNVALRERRGLVYCVDSTTSLFSDCGTMTIYFGCDPSDVGHCRRLVADTLRRLADEPMSARRLDAAKKQYLGQLCISSANHEQLAIGAGRTVLMGLHMSSMAEIRDRITSISAADICEAAAMLAPERCSTLTFG